MSRASVANIEAGLQSVTVQQLIALAAALEVEVAELVPAPAEFTEAASETQRLEAAYHLVLRNE